MFNKPKRKKISFYRNRNCLFLVCKMKSFIPPISPHHVYTYIVPTHLADKFSFIYFLLFLFFHHHFGVFLFQTHMMEMLGNGIHVETFYFMCKPWRAKGRKKVYNCHVLINSHFIYYPFSRFCLLQSLLCHFIAHTIQ